MLLSPAVARADDANPNAQPATAAAPLAPVPASAVLPPVRYAEPRNSIWYKDTLGDALALSGVGTALVGAVFFAEANATASAATSGTEAGWASHGSTAKTESVLGGLFIAVGAVIFAGAQWRYMTVTTRGNEDVPEPSASSSMGLGAPRTGFRWSYAVTF
jgi:hypothetical protein